MQPIWVLMLTISTPSWPQCTHLLTAGSKRKIRHVTKFKWSQSGFLNMNECFVGHGAVQLIIFDTLSSISATVMVIRACSEMLLWSTLRSTLAIEHCCYALLPSPICSSSISLFAVLVGLFSYCSPATESRKRYI